MKNIFKFFGLILISWNLFSFALSRNLGIEVSIRMLDRRSLQVRQNALESALIQGQGIHMQATEIVALQNGSHLYAQGGAVSIVADTIISDNADMEGQVIHLQARRNALESALIQGQGIHMQATDIVSVQNGSRLNAQGGAITVVADRIISDRGQVIHLQAKDAIVQNGSRN
jgi:hypothetical protein